MTRDELEALNKRLWNKACELWLPNRPQAPQLHAAGAWYTTCARNRLYFDVAVLTGQEWGLPALGHEIGHMVQWHLELLPHGTWREKGQEFWHSLEFDADLRGAVLQSPEARIAELRQWKRETDADCFTHPARWRRIILLERLLREGRASGIDGIELVWYGITRMEDARSPSPSVAPPR